MPCRCCRLIACCQTAGQAHFEVYFEVSVVQCIYVTDEHVAACCSSLCVCFQWLHVLYFCRVGVLQFNSLFRMLGTVTPGCFLVMIPDSWCLVCSCLVLYRRVCLRSSVELQYAQQLVRVKLAFWGMKTEKVSKKCDGYSIDHTKKPRRLW